MLAPTCSCPEGIAFGSERGAATARRSWLTPTGSSEEMSRGNRRASEEVGAGRRPRRDLANGEGAAPTGPARCRRSTRPSLDVPDPVAPATNALGAGPTRWDATSATGRRGPCRGAPGEVLGGICTAGAAMEEPGAIRFSG